jgi:solute carrier family 35 protein F5
VEEVHDEYTTANDVQELMHSSPRGGDNSNDNNYNGIKHNDSSDSIELTSYLDETTSVEASALGILDDYSFNNEFCVQHYEPTRPMESRRGDNSNNNDDDYSSYLLSHRDHISMASKVAPMWFLSNYFYAMSLEWTSIASSTVLASMGSIFAFAFATCSSFGDERVTKGKLFGVLLCFCGGVATTYTDVDSTDRNNNMRYLRHLFGHAFHVSDLDSSTRSLLGDLAGLTSAIGYGAYTVLLRHLCPKDENRMSMQLLFGYIGLLNMSVLLPVAVWVIVSSSNNDGNNQSMSSSSTVDPSDWDYPTTTSHTLTMPIFLFLLLKGLLDNVLSDYLWARAVVLTTATVASVGVGLTIPMAFVADWIMGNYNGSQSGEVGGAIMVLIGFVFVNIDGCRESKNDDVMDDYGNDAQSVEDVNVIL